MINMSYADLRAADLDWIVRLGYSSGSSFSFFSSFCPVTPGDPSPPPPQMFLLSLSMSLALALALALALLLLLLQVIIWRIRPIANDNPDGPVSCK